MVLRVHRVRVQLHDTHQLEHRHRGHDLGQEQRAEYTDVPELDDKRNRRQRFLRQKGNFIRSSPNRIVFVGR